MNAEARHCDVADRAAVDALAEEVGAAHDSVDIVVNNAGIGAVGGLLETSPETWSRVLDINLEGVVHGCRAFGRQMVERGQGGHIVNVSSMAAYLPSKQMAAYNTSKAAVLMLSECLRAELAESGIGVSAICPGVIQTPITTTTVFAGKDDAEQQRLRRLGDPRLRPARLPAGRGGRSDPARGAPRPRRRAGGGRGARFYDCSGASAPPRCEFWRGPRCCPAEAPQQIETASRGSRCGSNSASSSRG